MQQENIPFNKKLEKMISLLKKIKDNSEKAKHQGLDESFFKNVDFTISNYEMIKTQMPGDFVEQNNNPLFGMMNTVFDKIYQDLQDMMKDYNLLDIADEIDNYKEVAKPAVEIKESGNKSVEDELKVINNMLTNPEISEEEMNELLDLRADLIEKSSKS
ncbi:MAG: hypothetical protein HN704_14340 [Bacteroidetes bacterium]|nr:hypothetical protein [Bacteroidota bacterium]